MDEENLLHYYRNMIGKRAKKAIDGIRIPFDELTLVHEEKEASGLVIKKESTMDELRETRQNILMEELYDGLIGLDEDQFVNVAYLVKDPLLNSAFIWFAANKGIKNTDKDEFANHFNPRDYEFTRMHLPSYIRPLVLLSIIQQRPDKIDDLDPSSSYFPHRLFIGRRLTIYDVDIEIAGVLPSLYSEELLSKLPRIEGCIEDRSPTVAQGKLELGKYSIPKNSSFKWKHIPGTEKELDNLYNNVDMKREIYNTLLESLLLISKEYWEGGKSPKKSVAFRTSPTEFTVAMQAIQQYVRNQFLYVWRKSKGKFSQPTVLSEMVGAKARMSNDILTINIRGQDEFYKLDGNYMNTAIRLPFCASLLNRHYKSAIEVNRQQE
jgi:hypothetical protein